MAHTWKLLNLDGSNSPLVNRLDVSLDETGRLERFDKEAALDQRFRVAVLARRGRRKLALTFGSRVWDRLNGKSFSARTSSLISADMQQLVKDLKELQSDAVSRITLTPSELIEKISALEVEEIDYGFFRTRIELKTQSSAVTVTVGNG